MGSPINSINSTNPYDNIQSHGGHSHAEKTSGAQQAQQIQNPQAADPEAVHKHGGGHGGGGGHAGGVHTKMTQVEEPERSFRSHFRHLKSPNEIINQQRLMRDLELQEQLAKAAARKTKMVEASKQLEKKGVGARNGEKGEKKKKNQDQSQEERQ